MNDAKMTTIACQPIESVEMTQLDPKSFPTCERVPVYVRFPLPSAGLVFHAYGTFRPKLRHLNTNRGLATESRHYCSTSAALCNEFRSNGCRAASGTAEASAQPLRARSVGRRS